MTRNQTFLVRYRGHIVVAFIVRDTASVQCSVLAWNPCVRQLFKDPFCWSGMPLNLKGFYDPKSLDRRAGEAIRNGPVLVLFEQPRFHPIQTAKEGRVGAASGTNRKAPMTIIIHYQMLDYVGSSVFIFK